MVGKNSELNQNNKPAAQSLQKPVSVQSVAPEASTQMPQPNQQPSPLPPKQRMSLAKKLLIWIPVGFLSILFLAGIVAGISNGPDEVSDPALVVHRYVQDVVDGKCDNAYNNYTEGFGTIENHRIDCTDEFIQEVSKAVLDNFDNAIVTYTDSGGSTVTHNLYDEESDTSLDMKFYLNDNNKIYRLDR